MATRDTETQSCDSTAWACEAGPDAVAKRSDGESHLQPGDSSSDRFETARRFAARRRIDDLHRGLSLSPYGLLGVSVPLAAKNVRGFDRSVTARGISS